MLRKRDKEYLRIDPNDPNIAYYYSNQKYKIGEVKSVFIGKGWKYSFYAGNGTIKKVRCYFFKEYCKFVNPRFPGGISYRVSILKTHMSSALISPILNEEKFNSLFDNDYHKHKNWWFLEGVNYQEGDDLDKFVLDTYTDNLTKDKDVLLKKLELINNKLDSINLKQTWSKNGYGDDYKYSNNEDDWVNYV